MGGAGSVLRPLLDIEWPSSERDIAYAVLKDAFEVPDPLCCDDKSGVVDANCNPPDFALSSELDNVLDLSGTEREGF